MTDKLSAEELAQIKSSVTFAATLKAEDMDGISAVNITGEAQKLLAHVAALEDELVTSENELRSIQEIGTLDETDDGGPWLDPAAQIAADYFATKEEEKE